MKKLIALFALVFATSLFAQAAAPAAPVTAQYKVGDAAQIYFVSASGTPPLSFQWTRNGSPISGATSPDLKFPSLSVYDSATYALIVTNSAGSTTSNTALVTVNVPAGNVIIKFVPVPPATTITP